MNSQVHFYNMLFYEGFLEAWVTLISLLISEFNDQYLHWLAVFVCPHKKKDRLNQNRFIYLSIFLWGMNYYCLGVAQHVHLFEEPEDTPEPAK